MFSAFDEYLPNCCAKPNGCAVTDQPRKAAISMHVMRNVVFIIATLLPTGIPPAMASEPAGTNSSGVATMSDTQSRPGQAPVQNFKPPYPFTADELWEKILKVVALPDGYVTRTRVEDIFGVKTRLAEGSLKWNGFNLYETKRGINWYFDITVGDKNARESYFIFQWGNPVGKPDLGGYPPHPANMCIPANEIIAGISVLGWRLVHETRHADVPDHNTYRKGERGFLNVGFDPAQCLLMILIVADDRADFLALSGHFQ